MCAALTLADLKADSGAYGALRKIFALRSYPTIAIVGAGMSVEAGLPTWPMLRNALLRELEEQIAGELDRQRLRTLVDEAESIRNSKDYWQDFGRLLAVIGEFTFAQIIQDALSEASSCGIPNSNIRLWRLPIRGVISLNLDNLMARAFSATHPGVELKHLSGRDAAKVPKLLNSLHQFLYNVHGMLDIRDSWVFTGSQLQSLQRSPGYNEMLRTLLSTHTAIFLGISADDQAISGPLTYLSKHKIEGPAHYWITDRTDRWTREWAESSGVRLITYDSTQGHGLVQEILEDLALAEVSEPSAPPVLLPNLANTTESVLSAPEALASRPKEEIRQTLNQHAIRLLSQEDGLELYNSFLEEYEEPIHDAWFVATGKGQHSKIFGYEIQREIAEGAFGRVFRAQAPSGETVAVKLLLHEVLKNRDLLHSFRRGVKAMEIISRHDVPGMVAYKEATELPAFIVMEWIEGLNLFQAKAAKFLDEWHLILKAARDLVSSIKRVHELPEGVLHRDIRPANVMLKFEEGNSEVWDMVVLDFDLSTFSGAMQKSVLAKNSVLGYLAPEQLETMKKFKTRTAAVDVFGLGMTLFFLCGGREPSAFMQRNGDFRDRVREAVMTPPSPEWRSLPQRVERLLLGATVDEQSDRWSLHQILEELNRLYSVLTGSFDDNVGADMLTEELAARCPRIASDYEYHSVHETVLFGRPPGFRLIMQGAREAERISLTLEWVATGDEERSRLAKYVQGKSDRAAAALRGQWANVSLQQGKGQVTITASISASKALRELDDVAMALDGAVGAMSFAPA